MQTDGSIDITPKAGELVTVTGAMTVTGAFTGSGGIDGTIGGVTPADGTFLAVAATTGTFSGVLLTTDGTDASSATVASLKTAGGISAVKALWIGTTSRLVGNVTIDAGLLAAGDDQGAIGASGTAFSDLFLASGAVINFNAGDVTLTHNSNVLTMAGGVFSQDDVTDATSSVTGSIHTDGGVGVALNLIVDGSIGVGKDVPIGAIHIAGSGAVGMSWEDTAEGFDGKIWNFAVIGSQFLGRVVEDDFAASINWLEVNRTALNVDQVHLQAGTAGIVLLTATGGVNTPDFFNPTESGSSYKITNKVAIHTASSGTILHIGSTTSVWSSIVLGTTAITTTINGSVVFGDTVDINDGAIDGTVIGANSAANGSFATLNASGNLAVSGTGPHAFGTASVGWIQTLFTGAFTSDGTSNSVNGLGIASDLVTAPGDTFYATGLNVGSILSMSITTHSTFNESIASVSSVRFSEPDITNNLTGTGVITVAATVYIANAPTEGETNAALYVASGITNLQGDLLHAGTNLGVFGATPTTQQAHIIDADGSLADITTKFNTLLADLEGYGLLAA